MSKIIVLNDSLVSKIAAGEVVERPASVVKELVENCLDAGAKRIAIEVKEGGKKLIKVADDGHGMSPEDAKLSLERHSTSKIRSADDLFNIRTLGFRGEALPSIASISRFELITSDGNGSGTRIKVEGAKIKDQTKIGCPPGTTVTVEDLFFNTPARLKFQKGKSTELSHIVDIVSRFILSNPQVSFSLKSDGEEAVSSVGSGKLTDAIASIYGVDMAKTMLEVSGPNVKGYVTQPVVTKSDRYGESFFVNGRFVRNALLSKALEEPYRTLIPNGKYPIAVLFIEVDPANVDVNVHPAKREVKFSRPDVVMKAITAAVLKALGEVGVEAEAQSYSGSWKVAQDNWRPEMIRILTPAPLSIENGEGNESAGGGERGEVFQLNLTYIVAIDGEDLVIIDQHAAHERIMYEKIKNKVISGIQALLVPRSVEIEPSQFALISDNFGELIELGFDIEIFGKNTVMVRGIPAALKIQNIDTALSEILSELSASFKIKSIDERREAIWKMMACRSAVKAGDKLSVYEMESLVKELYSTSNPTTCPHGRPTMARISRFEMEKMFGR